MEAKVSNACIYSCSIKFIELFFIHNGRITSEYYEIQKCISSLEPIQVGLERKARILPREQREPKHPD